MNKFGKFTQKIKEYLLLILFERGTFSYQKIVSIHEKEQFKIQGVLLQKYSFLYLLPYKTYVREALWSLKFKNNKSVAKLFGTLLVDTLLEYLIEWEQFQNFDNPLLITVPSSRQSLRKRGFNQNDLIIKSFLEQGGQGFVSYHPNIIKKIKNTPRQSRTKNKQERLTNPKGAFAVANAHSHLLRNRNIILFDDVLTSGATT